MTTTDSLSSKKLGLRRGVLERRDSLTTEQRIEFSVLACEHGATFAPLVSASERSSICAGYHPIRSELDPRPLMSHLRSSGCRLCLPVVVGDDIEFRLFGPDTPLESSGFGTYGPSSGESVDPSVLVVPLSAYDSRCGRMGYGKGFYDRAISRLRTKGVNPFLVGMAFSTQQIDDVPMDSNDCYLDAIITERGIIERNEE